MLNEKEIKACLHTEKIGREIYYYKETDSTNIRAKQHFLEGATDGTLVIAEQQTTGRGRRGRIWESPQGGAVYMSVLLKPEIHPSKASMLTLLMALSLARSFTQLYGMECGRDGLGIKWPNDIVLHQKKITGILTEMSAKIDSVDYVIIGVGMNINNTEFSEELSQKATSLLCETGVIKSRAEVLTRALECFEEAYKVFQQDCDLKRFRKEYEKFLVNKNVQVRVLDPKGEYTGIARGINEQGELLVEKGGEVLSVYSGEVSVRGIYGYV